MTPSSFSRSGVPKTRAATCAASPDFPLLQAGGTFSFCDQRTGDGEADLSVGVRERRRVHGHPARTSEDQHHA